MKNWAADFETLLREDIMLVCEVLAKALKQNIDNGVSVLIRGGEEDGKSAVVDGLTAACMDDGPIFLPKCLVEDEPDDAAAGIRKIFQMNSRPVIVTFNRSISSWRACAEEGQAGINFLTQTTFNRASTVHRVDDADIAVDFRKNADLNVLDRVLEGELELSDLAWLRVWAIQINSPDLQTPEMVVALDTLKTFYGSRANDTVYDLPSELHAS